MPLHIEDHLFRMIENQMRLADFLQEFIWGIDTQRGILTFTREQKGLFGLGKKQTVLAEIPVQLIGSESEGTRTWLWTWANTQSRIPETLLRGIQQVRQQATTEGASVFLEPGEIPLTGPTFGMEMAIICTGTMGGFCPFRCPYPGGALFVSLDRAPFPVPATDALTAFNIIQTGIQEIAVAHRPAVLAYLGPPLHAENETLVWNLSGTEARITFDSQGRVADMQTALKPAAS